MISHTILIAPGKNMSDADLKMAACCDIWEATHPDAEPLDMELDIREGNAGVVAALGITYWEPDDS